MVGASPSPNSARICARGSRLGGKGFTPFGKYKTRSRATPKLHTIVSSARLATVIASACVKPHFSCHAKNFFCTHEYGSSSFQPPAPSQSSSSSTIRKFFNLKTRGCHVIHCTIPEYAFGLNTWSTSGRNVPTRAFIENGICPRGAIGTFSMRTPSSIQMYPACRGYDHGGTINATLCPRRVNAFASGSARAAIVPFGFSPNGPTIATRIQMIIAYAHLHHCTLASRLTHT